MKDAGVSSPQVFISQFFRRPALEALYYFREYKRISVVVFVESRNTRKCVDARIALLISLMLENSIGTRLSTAYAYPIIAIAVN